ncbi:localization factor PodJL [Pseudorhizobium tarimense]|uniref:Localization factor PodJL n=1 Tax=Pseudorhizobium tarimense TaxID=1079109 RepID=A0ABV2HC34_9HYPH|nr:peptidoglycan-binding protein [Pseudorhizobium tarimense]MCJ8521231.1 peptidoglycan-binding protein [Pseudorhizobium tarimense]
MNASRSTSPRTSERSSLDALNRTIEGLEARIEGLMKNSREPRRQAGPEQHEATPSGAPAARPPLKAADPLEEIRERQRALAKARETELHPADPIPAMPRPRLDRRPETRAQEAQRPASAFAAQTASPDETSLRDIAEALVSLRQELKHDIADGVAREMKALRAELNSIRTVAQGQQISNDLRQDLAQLADGIHALGHHGGPEAEALRAEYEELRAVIDGLAREDSLRHLDARWQGIEDRIIELDTNSLREELVGLAYRIDGIKGQLGSMSNSPAIHALEQKLVAVATAMEQLGSRMQPTDELNEQFAVLDERLDEISRAIAANGRAAAVPAADHAALQRLESRIGGMAEQIDMMARTSHEPTEGLSRRIEALSGRVEQLSNEEVALRLEERLEQLSRMLSQPSRGNEQAGLMEYLADISDKIDRLGDGQVNEALAERLDYLARRIDEMDYQQSLQLPAHEQAAIGRIEERLSDIAARLDETVQGPIGDSAALKSLEAQIANLSQLMSETPAGVGYSSPEIENRVSALESYVSTNDEYIVEAARQAAEAVVESFARRERAGAPAMDTEALAALAEDLRNLEELTRNKDERSQHTLNALHTTLVQIADRLDTMEDRFAPPMTQKPAMPKRDSEAARAAHAEQGAASARAASAAAAENLHAELIGSLSGSTTHAGTGPAGAPVFDETADYPDAQAEEPVEDSFVSPEPPAASAEARDTPKSGIFSQISKRLRSNSKPEASTPGRIVVEPTPSLDPTVMLPPERENEPLEPGSGTPDVRKILERVRASQAAATGGGSQPVGDRADYIAAARRAAKAAAMETDPTLDAQGKSRRSQGIGDAFSSHRRPIMMAVGAVLLVLMTMPLVKSLTAPDPMTQTAAVDEAPAEEAPATPAEAQASVDADTQSAPAAPARIEPAANDVDTTPPEAAPQPQVQRSPLIAPRPGEGLASTLEQPKAPAEAAEAEAAAAAGAPEVAAATPPEAPKIVVPASIGPESLSKAAEAGDPVALFEIGARYTEGREVAVDMAEAANWYKLAADRGSVPAQYRLGNLFEKGNGVARDLDKALAYYSQAADAGNASAMHNLAVLNASGAKGEPDYAAAVDWFKKAAELGVSDSQFNLAILYARGNGTAQNLVDSYKWFAIAAKGGDQDAAQKRDEVAKAMRKEQLETARSAAESWSAKPLDPAANSVQLPDEWAGETPVKTSSIDMEKAIRNIQAILNKNGFDAGAPDGKMGQRTIGAIRAFQSSIGQEPTGKINDALVKELLARSSNQDATAKAD